jgi:pimeloyl-ACP methyl ester carboxylesterase
MRKLLIWAMLPLLVVTAACTSGESGAPSAVSSNTVARAATTPIDGSTANQQTAGTGNTAPDRNGGSGGTSTPNTVDGGTATSSTANSSTATPNSVTPNSAGSGSTPTTAGAATTVPAAATITWTTIKGVKGVQQGTLNVPIDYTDPTKGSFSLYMVRHLAEQPSERIGTLLVNPGGPGFGGSDFGLYAAANYGQDLLDRFDILGWDPRGTGKSTPPIDCFSDYDHFFNSTDITPDTPAEKQQIVDLAKEQTNDCVTKNASILAFVGTNDSARDMDSIRKALGEQKITYFGFSYGSELGATWATLFPDTVRGAVLDGAIDPTASDVQQGIDQATGFETSLDTFLTQCSADKTCAFYNGGHADTAFDQLMQSMDEHPLPALKGRPPLTRGAALMGVAEAMYNYTPDAWPQLAKALAQAQKQNGSGLMTLYDAYFERQANGSYDNSIEALYVISCADDPTRDTVAQDDADEAKVEAVAPRMFPGTTGAYECTFFPPSTDPRIAITGKGAGPIVVVGTTGDPATPLAGSRKMAQTLEHGVLLVVDGQQHTGYNVNACSMMTVDLYLIDPVGHVPADGTECK